MDCTVPPGNDCNVLLCVYVHRCEQRQLICVSIPRNVILTVYKCCDN